MSNILINIDYIILKKNDNTFILNNNNNALPLIKQQH